MGQGQCQRGQTGQADEHRIGANCRVCCGAGLHADPNVPTNQLHDRRQRRRRAMEDAVKTAQLERIHQTRMHLNEFQITLLLIGLTVGQQQAAEHTAADIGHLRKVDREVPEPRF